MKKNTRETRISHLRRELGYKQIDFAHKCQLGRGQFSNIESRRYYANDMAQRMISQILNVPISELFDEDGIAYRFYETPLA